MSIKFEEFILGGVSACGAGLITNPLEVIKTRIQLQGELRSRGQYKVHYKNVFHAFYAVIKAENIISLQKGLVPALWYQFIMNGVRFGTYQCIDNWGITRNANGDIVFYRSVIAGAASGCSGAMVGSPFYMVKTHLQARASATIAVGHQHPYSSMTEAFGKIYRSYGVKGLWRGVTASMTRVTIGSSIQLATFSHAKSVIDKYKIIPTQSWLNTLLSAMLGGIAVVAIMTPFDVISTRLYNQPVDPKTGVGLRYSGIFNCFSKIFKTEGFVGYYKGWGASLLRLGPHTVISLFFWQELRKHYFNFKIQLNTKTDLTTPVSGP